MEKKIKELEETNEEIEADKKRKTKTTISAKFHSTKYTKAHETTREHPESVQTRENIMSSRPRTKALSAKVCVINDPDRQCKSAQAGEVIVRRGKDFF